MLKENATNLYDYAKTLHSFQQILEINKKKAYQKRQEYLEKIMLIFTQFVKKCEKEIDLIIHKKVDRLENNYQKVKEYLNHHQQINQQQESLIIAQFLIKPFERFPFSGNKNEKLFKEQYNLIQKASVLIEQTLIDSFNEDEVPYFQNQKFFDTLRHHGIGQQSLIKLRINPQAFHLEHLDEIVALQKNVLSLKLMSQNLLILMGDSGCVEIWDLEMKRCLKKVYLEVICEISSMCIFKHDGNRFLVMGFSDQCPQIWAYRCDNWKRYGVNIIHTRKVTKLIQYKDYLISGSLDGNICINSFEPFKVLCNSPHISSIEDVILKNTFLYILLKCSTVCQYDFQIHNHQPVLQFRRTLSTGYISIIRFPEQTSNFSGVACHIYGLSQIEITRKFKVQESNIINVTEMISDFIVLESKETSEYFAICTFQNSSAIRIYSLLSQELVYELPTDYLGEVGVAGYLPKMEITYLKGMYVLIVIFQSEFSEDTNKVRLYRLTF